MTLDGIFKSNTDESPFHSMHHAYIRYCTSDGHMGDRAASALTYGWHFRGRRVIAATMAALKDRAGLGRADRHQHMYFGGASAGGRGAMAALDFVSGYIGTGHVTVYGLLDSPLWIDQPPYKGNTRFPGFNVTTALVLDMVNATGHIPADCAALYPHALWKCLFGQYRIPLLRTPYSLFASQVTARTRSHQFCLMATWHSSGIRLALRRVQVA